MLVGLALKTDTWGGGHFIWQTTNMTEIKHVGAVDKPQRKFEVPMKVGCGTSHVARSSVMHPRLD